VVIFSVAPVCLLCSISFEKPDLDNSSLVRRYFCQITKVMQVRMSRSSVKVKVTGAVCLCILAVHGWSAFDCGEYFASCNYYSARE